MKKYIVIWGYPVILCGFVVASLLLVELPFWAFFWSFMVGFIAALGLLCLGMAIGLTFPRIGKRLGISRNKKWDET